MDGMWDSSNVKGGIQETSPLTTRSKCCSLIDIVFIELTSVLFVIVMCSCLLLECFITSVNPSRGTRIK